MTEGVSLLQNMGLPGLVIGGLLYALRYVFKAYQESQEARIQEGNDNRTAIERNTASSTALIEYLKTNKQG